MKKCLIATVAASMLLSGCGAAGGPSMMSPSVNAAVEANATRTLLTGFKQIHMAVFAKLDANSDNAIDEYEAGQNIDLKDHARADKNKNGKLTKAEFIAYATGGTLFGFMRQNKTDFMKQAREAFLRAFTKLDKDGDRLLKPSEMGETALKKVGVNLRIDGLHVKVIIDQFEEEMFTASDKTADGSLSVAEYEDYCVSSFIKLINPKFAPTPNPDEPVDPPAPPAPPAGDDNEDS